MKGYDKKIIHTVADMAWPAIVESFCVALAGLVDSYMVSSLGSSAVAAVGLTTQPKFMGLALFFAVNVSVAALVARRFGEKRQDDANRILVTTILFVIIAAVILSITLVTFAGQIISFCGSNEDTHDAATLYYRIIMGGMIFNCLQMAINSAQRGAGNTRITMRTNMTSNIVNICMNYLLIGGHFGFPALGIAGAALATVSGTVVAFIMSVISIMDTKCFVSLPYIIERRIGPDLESFKSLVKVGYSVFFEQILMRIGFMMTAIMAADQGTYAMAAHQVGMNILGLSFSFGDGLQATSVALIGRSLGQKNPDLAKEYGRTCRMFGGAISVALVVIYFLGARQLYMLFFQEDEIVDIGVKIMYMICVICVFQVSQVVYTGSLRGAGDTLYTAMASAFSVTIVRTAVSYFCGYALDWGIIGIWMGVLGDQVTRYILSSTRFKAGKWINIRI